MRQHITAPALALALAACGPTLPTDKGPPMDDTTSSSSSSDGGTSGLTSSGNPTETATTEAETSTTEDGTSTDTGTTSATDPTGGPCVIIMCDGVPCVDMEDNTFCAPPCDASCRTDDDCVLPGVLFCSGGGDCVDANGTIVCS